MRTLTLRLKGIWFQQIRDGLKPEEYRLATPYWRKRLEGREYDQIVLTWGYPKGTDHARRLVRPWLGCRLTVITHPEFGCLPVDVFAINVADASVLP
ncbi:ASCH domain-containing protein [Paraburkholderia rhizosphaerae]|uniref:ASCH domain-containing protein n=1 Tax=Paraburkholderia rhizosphaerae TaxID=480658 RepID=A0A4R8LPX8_9BURK|nr:ASCH domain-containing protein [Paraburkholderia rhizosphaerae]TDY48296.1 hypothetical protein BX592_111231 [Paraburkholderia rhizosphaerae]